MTIAESKHLFDTEKAFRVAVMFLSALAFFSFATSYASANADRRVALVIGVGAYQSVPKLANPVPDAQAVSAVLKSLGYDVVEGYDTDLAGTQRTIKQFREKLSGAAAAVFYYAGHGIAVKDENYILPVDAKLSKEADVDFNTIPLKFVISQMEQETKVNIVLLDACRDNPFEEQLKRSLGTRSAMIGRGLSAVDTNSTHGLLISFATSPRNVALDGEQNSNSPFTTALLRHMASPGVPVSVVMDRVREDVYRSTNEKQRPWVNTSIIGEFFINPKPKEVPAVVASTDPGAAGVSTIPPISTTPAPGPGLAGRSMDSAEVTFWESVQKSGTVDEYKAYIAAFPAGTFAALARSRIEKLQNEADKKIRAVGDTNIAGTATTEKSLKLSGNDVKEIHDRLRLISFDPGASATKFGPKSRAAVTEWQKSRNFPDTGFLTDAQRNALLNQTDDQYERWKNTAALAVAPQGRTVTGAAPAQRPVKRTIVQEQRRRTREYAVDRPIPANGRRTGGDGGSAVGAAIIGGVVGGLVGGAIGRRW